MSRIETDSLGEVNVPDDAYWGAQTQRSLINFAIGQERMPLAVLHALALIKKAAAGSTIAMVICPRTSPGSSSKRPTKYSTAATTISSRWWSGRPAVAPRAT